MTSEEHPVQAMVNYPNIAGVTASEQNKVSLFLTNKTGRKYLRLSIDEQGSSRVSLIDLSFKKEKNLCSFNDGQTFQVFNIVRNSSIIKQYDISNQDLETITYNLEKESFKNERNNMVPLFSLVSEREVGLVDNSLPNTIDITSKKVKAYVVPEGYVFTLDHSDNYTRTIFLNKREQSTKVDFYGINKGGIGSNEMASSNSFIYGGRIYQMVVSKSHINLMAKDFASKETVNVYSFDKDEDFGIANSPMVQEGGTFASGERELEKTQQFLRKLAKSKVGMTVAKKGDTLQLGIGGSKQISAGSPMMMPMGGIPGAPGAVPMFNATPIYFYASYSTSRSISVNCLFTIDTFEHIEGPVNKNIFDRIKVHTDKLIEKDEIKKLSLETVFKYGDNFMQGYYDKKTKTYRLTQFEE